MAATDSPRRGTLATTAAAAADAAAENGDARQGLRLPAGSWDCHFHVFEAARYPYAAERSYTPADAPFDQYRRLAAALGIERGVLVHPSVLGRDHRALEDTLIAAAAGGHGLRGVAVVDAHCRESDLERWHRLGVRGTRLNALFAGGVAAADLPRVVDLIRPFGWHLQMLIDIVASPQLLLDAARLGVPLVLDHYGHPQAAQDESAALASAGYRNLLALLKEGRAWVKLSGPYRFCRQPGFGDARPLLDALLHANPAHLVWGTDWPHPAVPPQDDRRLTDLLFAWLSPAEREQVFVHNPTQLYASDN